MALPNPNCLSGRNICRGSGRTATRNSAFCPNAGGFTLLELLVVIAIIAILASLIAPALAKAKEKGSRTACCNNLRQIMLCTREYADDNADVLPYKNQSDLDTWGSYQPGWLYDGISNSYSSDGVMTGVIWPYMKGSTNSYWCPLDKAPHWDADSNGNHLSRPQNCSSYCITFMLRSDYIDANTGVPIYTSHKLAEFPPSGVCYWEANENNPYSFYCGCNTPNLGETARHNSGGENAFFDGHVEYVSDSTFTNEANTFPSPLNCNPVTPNGAVNYP